MNENKMSEAFVAGFMSKCAEAGIEKEAAIGLLRGLAQAARPALRRGIRTISGRRAATASRIAERLGQRARAFDSKLDNLYERALAARNRDFNKSIANSIGAFDGHPIDNASLFGRRNRLANYYRDKWGLPKERFAKIVNGSDDFIQDIPGSSPWKFKKSPADLMQELRDAAPFYGRYQGFVNRLKGSRWNAYGRHSKANTTAWNENWDKNIARYVIPSGIAGGIGAGYGINKYMNS